MCVCHLCEQLRTRALTSMDEYMGPEVREIETNGRD